MVDSVPRGLPPWRAILASLRPVGWIPPLFASVVGLADGGFSPWASVVVTLVAFGPCLGGAIYTVNFIADAGADRISKVRKDILMAGQPFAAGRLSPVQGICLASACFALGLGLLAWLGLVPLVAGLAVCVLGISYSVGPRWKTVPGADVIANALVLALCYLGARSAVDVLPARAALPLTWMLFLVAATYLLTEILDYESDTAAGLRTTCTVLGIPSTLRLSRALYLLSLPLFLGSMMTERGFAYVLMAPGIALGLPSYLRHRSDVSPAAFHGFVKRAVLAAAAVVALIPLLYAALTSVGLPVTWG